MPNLLTALDMHIEVQQGLQKIDSFQQDMFLPEEIDLQLNKQQDRFIEQLTNRQFQDKQVRVDYIKNLIVKNKLLPVFAPLKDDENYEPYVQYAVLPSDYLHMVSDRSRVVSLKSCENIEIEDELITTEEYIDVLQFPDPTDDPTGSFYIGLKIFLTGTPAEILYTTRFDQDPLDASKGSYIFSAGEKSVMIKDILETINMKTFGNNKKVYWEYYKDLYYPNSFIFVDVLPTANFTIQTIDSLGQPAVTFLSQRIVKEVAQVFDVLLPGEPEDRREELIENKMSEADELYDFRKNVYYKPSKNEPHSELSGTYIYLFREPSYILTALTIDYIRKPRQISLLLNQGCELAGSAPRLIVDATIEYFKLVIENPAYQGILQDNQIRNQNTLTNG